MFGTANSAPGSLISGVQGQRFGAAMRPSFNHEASLHHGPLQEKLNTGTRYIFQPHVPKELMQQNYQPSPQLFISLTITAALIERGFRSEK